MPAAILIGKRVLQADDQRTAAGKKYATEYRHQFGRHRRQYNGRHERQGSGPKKLGRSVILRDTFTKLKISGPSGP